MRPLWQILTSVKGSGNVDKLTCDECFAFMEHMAEEALSGAEENALQTAIRQHLANCPDCHEHHLKRLEELEDKLKFSRDQ
jgi:hypothetical protein